MKLYEIDSQYMEYLYKADSKVLIHNSGNHQRKFIAIKVLINGYKYFVPLSSPDKRDYYNDQDGHKKVQFTRVPTIKRIFNGNPTVESYLGKLLFNNMIPVPDGSYTLIGTKTQSLTYQEQKYKALLRNHLRWLNPDGEKLRDIASNLYMNRINNTLPFRVQKRCCDFLLLEEKC